jgi:hypothetical protein
MSIFSGSNRCRQCWMAMFALLAMTAIGVAGDTTIDEDVDIPWEGLDLTDWEQSHGLSDWPFEWEPTIVHADRQHRWKPAAVFERDLQLIRKGRLAGHDVMAFLPSCMCSSMVTSVHLFAETGAQLSLETGDTVTEVVFEGGNLYLTWEDDPTSANCCATRFRHSIWMLKPDGFVEQGAWWSPQARPRVEGWTPGDDTLVAPPIALGGATPD